MHQWLIDQLKHFISDGIEMVRHCGGSGKYYEHPGSSLCYATGQLVYQDDKSVEPFLQSRGLTQLSVK